MYVVATGNPFDGIALYGPFHDFDAALQHYQDVLDDGHDCWIVGLRKLDENDDDNA